MITCVLKGGLCNQLFQIFAIIAYSLRNGNPFLFVYKSHVNIGTKRKLYWDDFLISLRQFTTYNTYYNITNTDVDSMQMIHLPHHHYQEIPIIPKNENVQINSYFQSYKYFKDQEEKIFSMIRLNSQLDVVKKNYASLFKDETELYTISMHFRLGDYKFIQHSHNILPYEYYEKSIQYMISSLETLPQTEKIRILYFCEAEDNVHVLQVIYRLSQRFNEIKFIKVGDEIQDWEQLLLMACCDSNIIANSSYSWWGAYFNRNTEKIICYPYLWFGPNLSKLIMDDMFPDTWKKILF